MRHYPFFAVIFAALLFLASHAGATHPLDKVEGYGGFLFGMDLDAADAVSADDSLGPCSYPGVARCLTHPAVIFGEPARVVVQIEEASRRVRQILVEFDRVREENKNGECDLTANNILEELLKQYGHPETVDEREAVWFGNHRGLISFTSLCLNRHTGMVTVTYKESGRL